MLTSLEVMDREWLEQKTRSREQGPCGKRGRGPDVSEEEQKPKRARKMKFKLLGDDWGAEDSVEEEHQELIIVPTPVLVKQRSPPRRNNKRKRYNTTNTPSITDYFGRKRMQPIREESIEGEAWLGTQEDQDDFDELCDEYVRSAKKSMKQRDDDSSCGVQDDTSLLN